MQCRTALQQGIHITKCHGNLGLADATSRSPPSRLDSGAAVKHDARRLARHIADTHPPLARPTPRRPGCATKDITKAQRELPVDCNRATASMTTCLESGNCKWCPQMLQGTFTEHSATVTVFRKCALPRQSLVPVSLTLSCHVRARTHSTLALLPQSHPPGLEPQLLKYSLIISHQPPRLQFRAHITLFPTPWGMETSMLSPSTNIFVPFLFIVVELLISVLRHSVPYHQHKHFCSSSESLFPVTPRAIAVRNS